MTKDLHDAIMNILVPEKVKAELQGAPKGFYLLGHRDARHAAAELALISVERAVPTEQALYDIIRGTGYVTRGQAWDIVELVRAVLPQPK